MQKIILFTLLIALFSCGSIKKENNSTKYTPLSEEFKAYWYAGTAEINSYQLSQARYGEMRDGYAVLIFVTEDFLLDSQVKKEGKTEEKVTSVLKTNFVRKFTTGIYDYSMMSSIFTPVERNEFSNTLKLSTSSQEWCGHSYLQFNLKNNQYQMKGYSYFMNEADQNELVEKALFEDEIFNLLRMNLEYIPVGAVKLIPSTQWLRLSHQEIKAYPATISIGSKIDTNYSQSEISEIKISYDQLDRTVQIYYQTQFPHKIYGWEETAKSGFEENAKMMTTKAVLDTTILSPYWSKNQNKDVYLREKLGIE